MRAALILSLLTAGCGAPSPTARDLVALRRVPLHTFNERELDTYLRWLWCETPDVVARVAHLARKNIGQPYRLFLLGEFPFELHDPDPMYCLSASDCVTFVEQTYAMALARDWASFFRTLQRIRYKRGVVGFASRNHFTEADWNPNNAWLFEEVTDQLAEGVVQPAQTKIDRAAFMAQHGVVCDEPARVVHGQYVPSARLSSAVMHLRDGDIVEIVKGDGTWQYVSHMGLILHDAEGRATIVHSGRPAVHEELLSHYIAVRPGITGLRFLRFRQTGRDPSILENAGSAKTPQPGFGSLE